LFGSISFNTNFLFFIGLLVKDLNFIIININKI